MGIIILRGCGLSLVVVVLNTEYAKMYHSYIFFQHPRNREWVNMVNGLEAKKKTWCFHSVFFFEWGSATKKSDLCPIVIYATARDVYSKSTDTHVTVFN